MSKVTKPGTKPLLPPSYNNHRNQTTTTRPLSLFQKSIGKFFTTNPIDIMILNIKSTIASRCKIEDDSLNFGSLKAEIKKTLEKHKSEVTNLKMQDERYEILCDKITDCIFDNFDFSHQKNCLTLKSDKNINHFRNAIEEMMNAQFGIANSDEHIRV